MEAVAQGRVVGTRQRRVVGTQHVDLHVPGQQWETKERGGWWGPSMWTYMYWGNSGRLRREEGGGDPARGPTCTGATVED